LAGAAVDNNPPPADGATGGASLYASSCAACHGPLGNSDINGRSSAAISTAINMNAGGMGSLRSLSTAQVSAIATELTNAPGGSTPPIDNSTDGAALYANHCASCHGSLPGTDVGGEDAGDIREAIEENEGGMGMLGFLTSAQIRAIGEILDGFDEDDDSDDSDDSDDD
jgi:mono/diheme cytochrome c family protein